MSLQPSESRRWTDARPWQTNAALGVFGFALILCTRQLIAENDHYNMGTDAVAILSLTFFLGSALLLLVRPANTDRYTLPIILTFAIACRYVGLFNDSFLSTDVYRYAWDGVVQHAHISPYRYVPGDPALAFLRSPNQDLFDNINRRDYAHTIYPPVAQVAFYAITFLAPTVTAMKVAMVLFEGLTVYGLILLLRRLGLRKEWVLLYAWCPLCIWEFGSSGHLDAMVIALMVLAFLFRYQRRPVLTGLFFGLAVFTKFYPLVLFPALYTRRDWKMPAMVAAVGAAFYALYLSAGKMVFGFLGGYVEEEGMATGTRYFPLEWVQHLPGLHGLSSAAYIAFCGCVFLALTVWAWQTCCRSESPAASFLKPAMCFALAMMLMFSPHYPWYVAWLVPFFVLVPSLTVLTYVCGLFYLCTTAWAVGTGPKQFHLNEMLYAAVLIAAVVETALYRVPWTRARLSRLVPYGLGS